MAAPLTPGSSARSNQPNGWPAPGGGSTTSHHANVPGPESEATNIIKKALAQGPAADDNSPTVITSARKPHGPDAQHAESLVGRRLGHFELLESVGVGGMAAVIKAQDLDLGRVVALKILPPDMATDPENITRFRQEARAAARLDHENVARVYFCGEDQGLHFISFEFVEGENLRQRMERFGGSLPVAESLHYLMQVTAGLGHAASRGVVHRDIKPSNIIITPEGKAKIVDMGLARNLDARASNGQLTQSGVTLGTFDYISPEQAIEPRSADCRSDIYSLGCTFYHVLTGRPPVPEGTAAKKLHCHQHIAPLDPRELNPAIPDEMAAVLGKMMAKGPNQRYQSPEHLLQHLLVVARNYDLPATGDLAARPSTFVDQPLPTPPSLSSWWVGAAVVVLFIALFMITGGFGGQRQPLDSALFWQDKAAKGPAAASPNGREVVANRDGGDGPAMASGPQEAKNVQELVRLLRQPSAKIRLNAGVVYDLTKTNRNDAEPLEALFEGTDLTLECDRLIDKKPIVRLRASLADDGKSPRPGTLTIRGPADGSAAEVHISGIRFEFVDDEPDPGHVGLSILNVDQIDIKNCSFAPPLRKGDPVDGLSALALHQLVAKDSTATLEQCWFAPGSVAVHLLKNGAQSLQATECAFGPQFAVVRVQGQTASAEERHAAEVQFKSCSMLMTRGAVVDVDDQVPCRVTAGWCLFSNPELPASETMQAFVLRQAGTLAPETRFDGMKSSDAVPTAMPNGYQNVLAYANGDKGLGFDDCKRDMLPIDDAAARILTKHPWAEERPIARLNEPRQQPWQVRQAFKADDRQEALRLALDKNGASLGAKQYKNDNLLGAKELLGTRIYSLWPLGPPAPDIHLANNVKIWQPDLAEDAKPAPNVNRNLRKIIIDLKPGDLILVRHNGKLEMDPEAFDKPDTFVTIRPDENYRPELVPKLPTLKKESALFKIYSGQVIFQDLRFRLKPDRVHAIVAIPGGGQCIFRNCAVTLEEGDDLAVANLADPHGEMLMGMATPDKWTPRLTFENCFIRGRGRLLAVHGSRPFDLRLKNTLAVLDGSLIAVEPSSVEFGEASRAWVTLDHVTTYLTKNLLAQKAADKRPDAKDLGLVQVQIQSAHGLFVPAVDAAALVGLERIDSMEQMESVFQWREGRFNFYGFKPDQVMLHIQPDNPDVATLLERTVRDRWVVRWREIDYALGDVNFDKVQASTRFEGAKPSDFGIKSIVPPVKADFGGDIGAPIAELLSTPALRALIDE
jgi:serine/threonine protein kinase